MQLFIALFGTGFGRIYLGHDLVFNGPSNGRRRPFNPDDSERTSRVIHSLRDCFHGDVNIIANVRLRCVPDCRTRSVGSGHLSGRHRCVSSDRLSITNRQISACSATRTRPVVFFIVSICIVSVEEELTRSNLVLGSRNPREVIRGDA